MAWRVGRCPGVVCRETGIRLGVAVLLLAGVVGCGSDRSPRPTPTPLSRALIEQQARISLPAAAFNVQSYLHDDGRDVFIIVRFDLPVEELRPFLPAAGYTTPLREGWAPLFAPCPEVDWWPDTRDYVRATNKIYAGAEVTESHFIRKILVDKSHGGIYTIFLQHFEY